MTTRWQPTWWLVSSTGLAAGLLVLGLVLRRADLVIFALPLLGVTLWSLVTRPHGAPRFEPDRPPPVVQAGQTVDQQVEGHDLGGAEQWYLRRPVTPGVRWQQATVGGFVSSTDAALSAHWTAQRVGPVRVGGPATALLSPWAAYRAGPVQLLGADVGIRPVTAATSGRVQVPHPAGLVGANRSRVRGSGTEFADIRDYRAGDRLRSIDWARTARSGQLHVRDNYAEQDAAVLVVFDGLGGSGPRQRGLQCAATCAEFFLRRGDRVGLVTLGEDRPSFLPYRSGLGQYHRIADLLSTLPEPSPVERNRRLRLPLTPGALVLMVSPLLTDLAASAALTMAQHGVAVIVLDTAGIADAESAADRLAIRLRLLERRILLDRLVRAGVQIARWEGPDSLQLPLLRMSRRPPVRVGGR